MEDRRTMPRLLTKYLGWIEYDETSVIDFPGGLPGFGQERRFLSIRNEAHAPVVFLQSVRSPGLCFVALPAREVEAGYQLEMADEDAAVLGLEGGAALEDLEVLALISHRAGEPVTANLLAPVVVHRTGRRAVQAVRRDRRYVARHVLAGCAEGQGVC
jgi:flagellar assembly factor FliW